MQLAWKAAVLAMNGSKETGGTAMKCYWRVAALLVALCSAPIQAAENPPAIGSIGTGTFSCAKFAKYDAAANNGAQMDLVVQWAWGYMSAYNTRAAFAPTFQEEDAPSPVAPPDANSIRVYIRKFCEKNPQSNVTNATLDLIGALGGIVTSSVNFPAS